MHPPGGPEMRNSPCLRRAVISNVLHLRPTTKWMGLPAVLLGGIALLSSMGEGAAQWPMQSRGLALARQRCAECHAVERGMKASPIADAPTFGRIANTKGMTARFLSVEIRRAHEIMPDMRLSGFERREIIAYILSLRGAN